MNIPLTAFQAILTRVMVSPEVRQLAPEQGNRPARFSTRAMIQAERDMLAEAQRMARAGTHGAGAGHVEAAVRHVTGQERIAAVAGAAGAGKSTMPAAARTAWERQGLRVRGGCGDWRCRGLPGL